MIFAVGDRVKGLATLFDEGTEGGNGHTFSMREKAKGNGVRCFDNVSFCHRVRGRFVSVPPPCMHFLFFNPPHLLHIEVIVIADTPPPSFLSQTTTTITPVTTIITTTTIATTIATTTTTIVTNYRGF